MLKLSIIIPVYNCEKYVSQAIDSIIHNSFHDYEIIIINDGSTDHTYTVCSSYLKKYQNIKIINQDNLGVSSARNRGIQESQGQYIMFLDADDVYIKGFFNENLMNELNKNYDILAFSSYTSNLKRNRYGIDAKYQDCIMSHCVWAPVGHFGSCIYSKHLLKKHHILFDEGIRLNEDQVFKFKAFYCANSIRMYSQFCYVYNTTEGSIMKTLNGVYDIVEAWQRAYQWLVDEHIDYHYEQAISYIQIKIHSRMLLYAKEFVQGGHNQQQLIEELKYRQGYDMLMNISYHDVLVYLKNDLYLFQNDLDQFISQSHKEWNKIKYGRLLLKISLIRNIRDKRKYPILNIYTKN